MQRLDPPEPNPATSVGGARRHRPLRVLVLGVSWPLETFVERLLTGLAGQGIELTLAPLSSFAHPPSAWTDRHRVVWAHDLVPRTPRSIARVAVGRSRGSIHSALQPNRMIAGTRRNRERLFAAKWDVIYAPWISALTAGDDLLGMLSAPLVTSCRGTLVTIAPWDPSRVSHTEGLRRVFDRARLVHCVSQAIVGDAVALGLDPTKARVISPAVDPLAFEPGSGPSPASTAMQVVGVGSLTWTKDYEHALRSVRTAVDRGANLCFDIIGDGPDRQHLQFTIDDLDLNNRVRLLGKLTPDDIARRLRDADAFLHTSSSEGISNAVLEAMATGLPVVTTEAGGMREAVRDGVDGFVVGVREVDSTAQALVSLAADPAMRARMGAAGRQRILDDFRLDQQVAAFAQLLHEAAGR